ncbi:MAG: DUF4157 domain-containing protein [Bacteroidota bacterium]
MLTHADSQRNEAGHAVAHGGQQESCSSCAAVQRKALPNGLPDQLRSGLEALSGMDMGDVQVHRNSSKPAQLFAHAYTQQNNIFLGPGQEQHLAHEAWHVVQQRQGRVKATMNLNGTPVNDNVGLEREADFMGQRALAHRGTPAAPTTTQSGTGSSNAPVQRVQWEWDATTGTWKAVGASSSTSVPPTTPGSYHGESFEDTYTQSTDPTIKPFLRPGESYMGHRGAKKQLAGQKTRSDDIRVTAKKSAGLRGGAGQHEIVPTNMRDEVAKAKNPVLTGIMSGARTSTSRKMFVRTAKKTDKAPTGSREIGGHTSYALKPSGRGSTHTAGQGPGHDHLRKTARKLKTETDPEVAVNEMLLTHLEGDPLATDIMASPYITGMQPNVNSFGVIGPPVKTGTPDSGRLKMAQQYQLRREAVKDRMRSVKRHKKRGRSPSPPRVLLDDKGIGGGYVSGPKSSYPVMPVPSFGNASNKFAYTANMAGWMTQPQREGYDPTKVLKRQRTGSGARTTKVGGSSGRTVSRSRSRSKDKKPRRRTTRSGQKF